MNLLYDMAQQTWMYLWANRELIFAAAVILVIINLLLKGARRAFAVIVAVLGTVVILNSFGVTGNNIETIGVSILQWSDDIVAEVNQLIEDKKEHRTDTDRINESITSDDSDNTDTPWEGPVEVHFIDVGQADCTLIVDNEDTMLIDCGNYADAELVVDYLFGLGIEDIDYFVGTHPHEDHIGCAATIFRSFDVENVILSPADNTTKCYTTMMDEIEKRDINVIDWDVGDVFEFGQGEIQILGPVEYIDDYGLNNSSVVMLYTVGNTSVLFTGDAEELEESYILNSDYNLSCDILKVGHHGSSTSTSDNWLKASSPEYAVICVGKNNEYGHPHTETMTKLQNGNIQVYQTDLNGTIVFTIQEDNIRVDTEY